jgi:hypothetical protein
MTTSKKRKQRHHTVPRLHLRGFATREEMLVQLDLSTGRRTDVSVGDATVIKNFYTIVLPDGTRSDAWEDWLSDIENEIAPAVRRAIDMRGFRLNDDERELLARWIALQYLRGPDNRAQQAAVASFAVRAQVGMGGLAYLQYAMSQGLGRDVPLEEAEMVWDDITSEAGPQVTVSGDDHLAILSHALDEATNQILGRSWGRLRFGRHRLAVSDAPVNLVRDSDFAGGGLAGSRAVTVPLDRKTLLWLELPGPDGPRIDWDLEPSTFLARAHNSSAVAGAERFIYFHPDDDPVPAGTVLPRPRPERLKISGGLASFSNRDRSLDDVLDQIAGRTGVADGSLVADYTWPIDGYEPPQRPVSA